VEEEKRERERERERRDSIARFPAELIFGEELTDERGSQREKERVGGTIEYRTGEKRQFSSPQALLTE
jgi:IS5 family transposase